jgi:hypothetical protein
MLGIRRTPLVIAAAAFLFAATSTLATPAGFATPGSGERLQAGSFAEVTWSLDGFGPQDEEMELLLSLDGGVTFPIRVTADLDTATRRILWRVPSLPTDRARLAIRSGAEGEPAQETIRLVGPAFSIFAAGTAPLEELFAFRSEWRTREALGSAAVPRRESHRFGSSDLILSAPPDDIAAPAPPRAASLPKLNPVSPKAIARLFPPLIVAAVVAARTCPTPLRE